jgi:hypothetical protein
MRDPFVPFPTGSGGCEFFTKFTYDKCVLKYFGWRIRTRNLPNSLALGFFEKLQCSSNAVLYSLLLYENHKTPRKWLVQLPQNAKPPKFLSHAQYASTFLNLAILTSNSSPSFYPRRPHTHSYPPSQKHPHRP